MDHVVYDIVLVGREGTMTQGDDLDVRLAN